MNLKSVVCHHGISTNSGHYTAVICKENGFICCDDLQEHGVEKNYILDTAYILIYDKRESAIPVFP